MNNEYMISPTTSVLYQHSIQSDTVQPQNHELKDKEQRTSTTTSAVLKGTPPQTVDDIQDENPSEIQANSYTISVSDYPEHSTSSYLVTFGAFCGLTSAYGLLNISGVLQTYIANNILPLESSTALGWIFSVNTFLCFLSCVFSGTYFDRNGSRRLVASGGVFIVAGLIGTASSASLGQFILCFGVITGIGMGVVSAPIIGVISHYFYKRRGFMNSLASTGGSFAGITYPFILRALFDRVGFSWGMRVFALMNLVCLVVSLVLCKERLPRLPSSEKGTAKQRLSYYAMSFDIKAFKEPSFILCCAGCVFVECAALSTAAFFASYAKAHGFDLKNSYLLVSLGHVGGIPGRWITGYCSDILGRYNAMIFTGIATGVFTIVTLVPFADNNHWILYFYTVGAGFLSGSVFSLLAVCCSQICKTEEFGRRFGTMYAITAVGTLVWIPISGAIIGDESSENYSNFIIFTGLTYVVSGLCYFGGKICCVGWSLTAKF